MFSLEFLVFTPFVFFFFGFIWDSAARAFALAQKDPQEVVETPAKKSNVLALSLFFLGAVPLLLAHVMADHIAANTSETIQDNNNWLHLGANNKMVEMLFLWVFKFMGFFFFYWAFRATEDEYGFKQDLYPGLHKRIGAFPGALLTTILAGPVPAFAAVCMFAGMAELNRSLVLGGSVMGFGGAICSLYAYFKFSRWEATTKQILAKYKGQPPSVTQGPDLEKNLIQPTELKQMVPSSDDLMVPSSKY